MYKIVASVRMHLYRKLFLFFNRLFRSSNWNAMLKLAFSGWWKTKTIITGLSYRYQLFVDFLVERKLVTSRHRSNGTRAQAINESWEIQLKNKDFFPGNKGLLLRNSFWWRTGLFLFPTVRRFPWRGCARCRYTSAKRNLRGNAAQSDSSSCRTMTLFIILQNDQKNLPFCRLFGGWCVT